MVSMLDSKLVPFSNILAGVTTLCSWARHFTKTLVMLLSTQLYKWIALNLILGETLKWTGISSMLFGPPSIWGYNIPLGLVIHMRRQCVTPENIHTSPTEGSFFKTPLPHPSGNFNKASHIVLNFWVLQNPPPPRKFHSLLWGEYGYFLALFCKLNII